MYLLTFIYETVQTHLCKTHKNGIYRFLGQQSSGDSTQMHTLAKGFPARIHKVQGLKALPAY